MRALGTTSPIPYRRQNGGDYLIPTMQLRPGLEAPGAEGFRLHVTSEGERREAAPVQLYEAER
jgi:NAD(P)H dehydrogenase (quinone)